MEGAINNKITIAAQIEALLFVHGEAMKIKKLAELLAVTEEEVQTGLAELSGTLNGGGRGLSLIISGDRAMLVTKPEMGELVKRIVSEELDSELSPASLETLSIVAYMGPISRAEIDYIRGVNSSFILRNLSVRGLVAKEASKDPFDKLRAGKPATGNFVYSATMDFLRHVGVGSPQELPEFQKYRDIVKGFISKPEEVVIPKTNDVS
ncbi:MAG: SMC-Scp complex subunit ScpB [Candidatus Colwellbacteria bacterium RIFCSPLOWO2_01_FULL_48_10]|uniref:SMC-Scp complex subunit ScpB n=1 Tax=Candidatus Colwellbacteria bacterium RIFCSPLOWO2_01_FULL_48_10 TaxID=1797690 RepID=A0A1G1Z4R7_9BACT|nr:MAG: SMC-Scp complex subunit ScpB [Candidatus Colwellbacteria bacterium RIFCSPLOWO2_01_FULL_48_10]